MKTVLRVALAWLPFWGLWLLFVLAFPDQSLWTAAVSATVVIGAAALLGVGVWWFSGVSPWPERLHLRFYGTHVLAGSLYALAWMLAILVADQFRENRSLLEAVRATAQFFPWQFLTGLWIYGLVTGVSYAVRTRWRLREQERLAAEARLAALRNQLNPHFLFNALHSLAVLVRRDPGAAQVAIEQLGEVLRYTLAETEGDEVPLSEEWRFTKTYLALEQMRFGARLAVTDELDPNTLPCLVPSFALQILVENAVRHGIGPSPSGGVVRVRSFLRDGQLTLEVSDTGTGAAEAPADPPRGRGLRLLRERLAALYGSGGTLVTQTVGDHGFTATVTLPARRE